jgi:hypothetical protein
MVDIFNPEDGGSVFLCSEMLVSTYKEYMVSYNNLEEKYKIIFD